MLRRTFLQVVSCLPFVSKIRAEEKIARYRTTREGIMCAIANNRIVYSKYRYSPPELTRSVEDAGIDEKLFFCDATEPVTNIAHEMHTRVHGYPLPKRVKVAYYEFVGPKSYLVVFPDSNPYSPELS